MVAVIILVVLGAAVVAAELQAQEEMAIKTDITELAMVATVVVGMAIAEGLAAVAALI
jgi:hypothetical protein